MSLDEETLKAKAEIIDQNINYLYEKEFEPEDSDFEEIQAVKHSLFEITESCIDIASHIIAVEGLKRPDSYKGYFQVLKQNEIISDSVKENMQDMAGFRNFLVHRYGDVENQKLRKIMKEDLDDVKQFLKEIYSYMEEGDKAR